MPKIDLNGVSLVLMVTMGCNSECSHCCLASDKSRLGLRLSEADMEYYIREARNVGIQSVVFTGGEPAVYLNNLYSPMALAQSFGMYIDLRTNGFWAENRVKAQEILARLFSVGLQRLGLSFDRFHEKAISLNCIRSAIEAAKDIGLQIYLDWMGKETRDEVLEILGIGDDELRFAGAPLRIGRARHLPNECFDALPLEEVECYSDFSDTCGQDGDAPLMTVFPGGYVSLHPCCWVHPRLIRKIKNGHGWLEELILDTVSDPAVNFLCDYGIGGLIGMAREEMPHLLKPYYSHQCEACFDLLGVLFPSENQLPDYLNSSTMGKPELAAVR